MVGGTLMASDVKKPDTKPDTKDDDYWKPWRDADADERRGWLRMPSGKAPDHIERWAKETGKALKWVNVKDDATRSMAYSPAKGPPWVPVHIVDGEPQPFFGRPGVDGHPLGSEVRLGDELQLSCMPADLYALQQKAIQEETDAASLGLGGQYEAAVSQVEGAAAHGSLYERRRP